eukprot:4692558-Pyramimonas_sp.AAC.1
MHELWEEIAQQCRSLVLSILNEIFNLLATATRAKGNGDPGPADVAEMCATVKCAQISEPVALPF